MGPKKIETNLEAEGRMAKEWMVSKCHVMRILKLGFENENIPKTKPEYFHKSQKLIIRGQ